MNTPSVENLKAQWKQQMGAAKVVWGRLTDDELLKIEGHAQKLAGLVQQRYTIAHEEADKQEPVEDLLAHLDDTKLPEGSEEYVLPGLDLLTESDEISYDEQTEEVKRKAKVLEQTRQIRQV